MENKTKQKDISLMSASKSNSKSNSSHKGIFGNILAKSEEKSIIYTNHIKPESNKLAERLSHFTTGSYSLFKSKIRNKDKVVTIFWVSKERKPDESYFSRKMATTIKPNEELKESDSTKLDSKQEKVEVLPTQNCISEQQEKQDQIVEEAKEEKKKLLEDAWIPKPQVMKSNKIDQNVLKEIEESLKCQLWHHRI